MTTWWKCQECHGTGRTFKPFYAPKSEPCDRCAGSGNAMVDGAAERHRRRLEEERGPRMTYERLTAMGGK